jgi:hypothetical protein
MNSVMVARPGHVRCNLQTPSKHEHEGAMHRLRTLEAQQLHGTFACLSVLRAVVAAVAVAATALLEELHCCSVGVRTSSGNSPSPHQEGKPDRLG